MRQIVRANSRNLFVGKPFKESLTEKQVSRADDRKSQSIARANHPHIAERNVHPVRGPDGDFLQPLRSLGKHPEHPGECHHPPFAQISNHPTTTARITSVAAPNSSGIKTAAAR